MGRPRLPVYHPDPQVRIGSSLERMRPGYPFTEKLQPLVPGASVRHLSERESQIVKLRLTGKPTREIAGLLRRSDHHVRNLLMQACIKLGVRDSLEMAGVLLLPFDSPLSPLRRGVLK